MNWLRKLRSLFRKEKLDAEMAEEMHAHLEFQTRENIARGMAPEEARYATLRAFGGVEQIKERAREQRGWQGWEQLLSDLRFAARGLRKSPGFTCAVVAALAVGIGLVTGIVNVAQPILWPDLPFRESDQLVLLRERSSQFKGYAGLVAVRFAAYAKHATSFAAIGAEKLEVVNLVVAGEPSSVRVSAVSEGFFSALGIACSEGRLFAPEEYQLAHVGETVVLTQKARARFFGGDTRIVGQDVMLGDRLRRVIGVLPPEFKAIPSFLDVDGIYVSASPPHLGAGAVRGIARLKPGVTLGQAMAELRTIRPEMPGPPSDYYSKLAPVLMSLPDAWRENRAPPFRIFLGATVALYLMGCATVANLMLSRAVGRRRELGVRLALGGTPGRIVRLIVAEALVLALLGAGGGVLVAGWAQNLMAHLTPVELGLGGPLTPGFPWRTLGLALALGVPTCVLAALVPARSTGRIPLIEALKEGAGSVGDSRKLRWLRGAFVVTQSALAVALLIGAGLLLRTVARLQTIDVGFDPAHKFVLFGSRTGPFDQTRAEARNAEIAERIGALPGVLGATQAGAAPLAGAVAFFGVAIENAAEKEQISAYGYSVSSAYFETLGVSIVAGTGFADLHSGDRPVAIVNESMARKYFPNESAIGRFLIAGKQRLEIIGIARDVAVGYRGTSMAMAAGGKPIVAQIYTPSWQAQSMGLGWLTLILRLEREPDDRFMAGLRRVVFEVDPSVVTTIKSMQGIVGEWSRTERQALVMLQVLSFLALALATLGTFSVMAYWVAQRRSELGLRSVLGATPGMLMVFVLRRGIVLGGVGIGLGLGAAAGASQFLRAILYETSPHDSLVYLIVAALLLGATVAACWLPARRAAKVDPMVALRAE